MTIAIMTGTMRYAKPCVNRQSALCAIAIHIIPAMSLQQLIAANRDGTAALPQTCGDWRSIVELTVEFTRKRKVSTSFDAERRRMLHNITDFSENKTGTFAL